MKYVKMLSLAALSAMALMAFASSASATTLEVNGSTQNASVSLSSSLDSGTSAVLRSTGGLFQNTCTTSTVSGSTSSPYTGTFVTGTISSLTFTNCNRTVTVHDPGSLEIHYTSGTNGTVYSEEAQVTSGSPIGTLNCETDETTHLGTLEGVGSGSHATINILANIDCGISAVWDAEYTVTSPTGLGVSS